MSPYLKRGGKPAPHTKQKQRGNTMNNNMVLIMVDECGDEVEIDRYTLTLDLDEDELEIWKERKIAQAMDRYPEAQGFYFEDRRRWGSMINMELWGWG